MRTALAVLFGLVAGVATVTAIVVAIVSSTPPINGQAATARPAPTAIPITPAPATPTLAPTAAPVVLPSGSPGSPSPSSSAVPTSAASPGESPSPGDLFGIGTTAGPLDVAAVGGGRISLASYAGKPVWVVFTGTWCPPCRDEYPLMQRFNAQLSASGLEIISVHVREDEKVVDAFARQLGISFPLALDPDGSASNAWGAIALPVHFFIGRDGRIAYGALGGIDATIMAEGLRTILPGVTIQP